MIKIIEANSKKLIKSFIEFPHHLYQKDPLYVPIPNLVILNTINEKTNPLFRNVTVTYFLAVDEDQKIYGRIAAIENLDHLQKYNDETGFFGFFDCVDDESIANILLDACRDWLGKRGCSRMVGPEDFTTNEKIGLLTDGFNKSPVFMMPYNFPYYDRLLEKNGLKTTMTLYSYEINYQNLPPEIFLKADQIENRLQENGIKIRPIEMKNFDYEIAKLRMAYNRSNIDNWGFVPLDEDQFRYMAMDLKNLIKPEHVWVVEKDNTFIGYSLTVPDFNQVFRKIRRGKMFPFGWLQLILPKKYIDRCRIMILGVIPEYRNKGIDWCLYANIARFAQKNGTVVGEASYVMKNNHSMRRMIEVLGGKVIHEYELYEGDI